MTRAEYLSAVIRVYLSAPGRPSRARRSDWAVATTFYQQAVPLETVEHAVRLATLRRTLRGPDLEALEPIHSLAYFRQVVSSLTPEALDPAYVDHVRLRFDHIVADCAPKPTSRRPQRNAASKPESRAS